MNEIEFRSADAMDTELLADIRVEAMKPSLEALGRFDPVRARQRFLETFVAEDTQLIMHNFDCVGFFVVRVRDSHLWFDHLYLRPSVQRRGLGKKVLEMVQQTSCDLKKPIRLMALKGSPANDFYMSLGFEFTRQEAFDNYYQWECSLRQ